MKEKKKDQNSFGELLKKNFSIKDDAASPEEIRSRILSGGKVTGVNAALLFLAILIASIGLNTNSTAVIIGAMLVSPLMGSILAVAYGKATADVNIVKNHFLGFIIQIIISVSTSTLFFLLSPIKDAGSELMARTSPTLFDALLAVVGGLAGIIGNTRIEKSNNVIPGVAIATALMPPLCTCGYSIANGKWAMLAGAAYLFIINSYFIFSSSEAILSLMKLPKAREISEDQKQRFRRRKAITTTIILRTCFHSL